MLVIDARIVHAARVLATLVIRADKRQRKNDLSALHGLQTQRKPGYNQKV
jgi:hypothetical protein